MKWIFKCVKYLFSLTAPADCFRQQRRDHLCRKLPWRVSSQSAGLFGDRCAWAGLHERTANRETRQSRCETLSQLSQRRKSQNIYLFFQLWASCRHFWSKTEVSTLASCWHTAQLRLLVNSSQTHSKQNLNSCLILWFGIQCLKTKCFVIRHRLILWAPALEQRTTCLWDALPQENLSW